MTNQKISNKNLSGFVKTSSSFCRKLMFDFLKTSFGILVMVFLFHEASGQDFRKYQEEQRKKFEKAKTESVTKLDQLRQNFWEYRDKRNAAFAAYIKNSWEEYQTLSGLKPPGEPKPDSIPGYRPQPKEEPLRIIEPVDIKPITPDMELPELVIIPEMIPDMSPVTIKMEFDFYGQELEVHTDKNLMDPSSSITNESDIADFWTKISSADYPSVIKQLFDIKDNLNLNDWGYYLLCRQLATQVSGENQNNTTAMTWALLNHSGYKVKIGFQNSVLYLMLPTIQSMYGARYMTFDDVQYFIPGFEEGTIRTYSQHFENAIHLLDLGIYRPLNLEGNPVVVNLPPVLGETVNAEISQYLIDFYNDMPLTDIEVYFNAPVSSSLFEALAEHFQPVLASESPSQQLNFLLRWVQTGFQYKTDKDQFGREKFFFAEELFYYPFSDCEDRSVLFSWLVRRFLNMDVIGLEYPGHMATAVNIPFKWEGNRVNYNGQPYLICDPTYRNAPIGASMPEYTGVSPNAIPLSNRYALETLSDELWAQIQAAGGRKTSRQSTIFDDKGNCYMTGTFTGRLSVGGKEISTQSGNVDVFLVSFDQKGRPNWLISFDNGWHEFSNGLAIGKRTLFISGNTNDISRENPAIFLMAVDAGTGALQWKDISGQDSERLIRKGIHIRKFSIQGEVLSEEEVGNQPGAAFKGVWVNGETVFASYEFGSSLGLRMEDITLQTSSEFNLVEQIKVEYRKIVEKNYDPYTAGLVAVFSVLKNTGSILTGIAASDALKENKTIEEKNPEIIENLKKVRHFKNENGRIVMKSTHGKTVSFYNMHFEDNSSVRVVDHPNGKTMIECLSGVKVGKAFISFSLNSMLIDHLKGDILFDYGVDHSKKVYNLKKDILEI